METYVLVSFRDKIIEKIKSNNIKFSKIQSSADKKIITMDKISKMTITEIESKINELQELIEQKDVEDYTINTYILLLEKAIDEFEYIGDQRKHKEFKKLLKNAKRKFNPNNKSKEDTKKTNGSENQNNKDDSDDED